MQSILQKTNSFVYSSCSFRFELLLLLISCFLFACSQQKDSKQVFSQLPQISPSPDSVNINTATVNELEKLPHVGLKTAQKIIEHREKYGRFRRTEHLLLIDGISDERFRAMKNLIRAE